MPTGSFIGVGNFKGLWNASTNSGSNSDLAPPLSGSSTFGGAAIGGLLATGTGLNTYGGGYNPNINMTASVGDYWQVFVAGDTEIDNEDGWQLNDWCVYQSSSATGMTWNRLSVTDTIAATIIGNPSESGLKKALLMSASANAGPTNAYGPNGELLFCSASDTGNTNKYFEGNPKLTWNNNASILNVTGTVKVAGTIEATSLHTLEVTSSILFRDGSTRFGDSSDDKHDFVGFITASMGITSSSGISGSYFLGDGSALTGISAGSSLGNSLYGNPATSRVPFWGVIDAGSKYGLSGSANLSFFTASNDLQVTGSVRATEMYVGTHIYHEGDDDTRISFTSNNKAILVAGNRIMQTWDNSISNPTVIFNSAELDTDFVVMTNNLDRTLWVDGGSDNVGIKCAPSGTSEALTVSGSTKLGETQTSIHQFTGSARFSHSITVGNGSSSDGIYHWDDADTKIVFTDDQIDFTAGGVTLLSLDETTQDIVIVGDGSDVDFQVKGLNDNHAIFVQGSSDNVGIGYSAPDRKLSVSGSTTFGRPSGEGDSHQFTGSIYVSDDIHVQDKIYGLGDADTYIDFSSNDQLSTYVGSKLISFLSTSGVRINPVGDAALDFGVQTANFIRGFHVDAASDNVGIRCAPSGTIQALTVSGSTLFGSASANTHQFTGSIYVSQNIAFGGNLHNASDDDTYLDFTNDRVRIYAGNVQFIDFDESSAQKATTLNSAGADIDLVVKSNNGGAGGTNAQTHTIFVEGSSAKVGIAEPSPQAQLDISGSLRFGRKLNTYHMATGSLELTGNIGLNTTASAYSLALPNTDTLMGRGVAYAWSTYSSARYKDNVFTLKDPLETAKKLRGVEFTWKESGFKDFGFIAEEVGKVLPQLVSYEADGKSAIGMDYAKITSLLVECVKTQQTQLETQEKRIKTLEKKLKS